MTDCSLATWREVFRHPVLVTGATIDALSVEEAKQHLNIDTGAFDDTLREYIAAATAMVEKDAEIALLTQTWALYLDSFPAWEIELRRLPVASISSVVYLDETGTSTTASASTYRLSKYRKPAILTPAYNQVWPVTYPVTDAVTITFVSGDTNRDAVPDEAKQAIRMLVGHWYRNRETVVSTGAQPIETPLGYESCISRLKWSGGV